VEEHRFPSSEDVEALLLSMEEERFRSAILFWLTGARLRDRENEEDEEALEKCEFTDDKDLDGVGLAGFDDLD